MDIWNIRYNKGVQILIFPILESITEQIINLFGGSTFWYIFIGIMLYLLFAGLMKIPQVQSLALVGLPFAIYMIYTNATFGWLAGVLVIIYGIMLFSAIKGLIKEV